MSQEHTKNQPPKMSLRKILAQMAKNPALLHNQKKITVAVEGNVGSGKTTFLKHFEGLEDVLVLAEPIDKWRNCNGHNLFAKMYINPKEWSFMFQSYVQLTMLQNHSIVHTTKNIKLIERSLFSARYCFVEKMNRDGFLSAPEFHVLDEWFKWINANERAGLDLIIYLRTTPQVAYERVLKRDRKEEKHVPFEYVKSVHELHEDWLFRKNLHNCPAPVLTIDANLEPKEIRDSIWDNVGNTVSFG